MPSCVLAYSGGLDTSVILGWLIDEGYDIHAVYVDLGQPCEDREAILKKARDHGAKSARIVDAREELCRDFAFPVLQWQAKYENIYLLGTSIARPLIAKACLQVAREVGFTDELYFSRMFKKATGYSPTFFREFETEIRGGSNLSMLSPPAPILPQTPASDTSGS